jgi:hypothetical protein
LAVLQGRLEYAVRVWASVDRLEATLILEQPDLGALVTELQAASSGKRYLLERRYRDALQTALREALPGLRATAASSLNALVEASVVLERTPKPQGADVGVLEAAVLLESGRANALRESLGAWLETRALRAELNGPFAPYSFTGQDFAPSDTDVGGRS